MNRLRSLLSGVTVLTLLASVMVAQGPNRDVGAKVPLPEARELPADGPRQTLSIDVDLVTFDVVVTDKNGDPIAGLEKQHFKIFEDNVEQSITNFSPTEAPLTVVILLEFGDTFGYWADDVVQPAAGFVNSLRENDWAALVAYDIKPEILVDFTRNKDQLFQGLQRLRIPAYRETSIHDAVYDTLQRLDNVDGKKAIFLVSTGLDTLSKHNYSETLRKAETSDTVIYAISMGQMARLYYESQLRPEDNITFLQADNVLRSYAERTGGQSFFPDSRGSIRVYTKR